MRCSASHSTHRDEGCLRLAKMGMFAPSRSTRTSTLITAKNVGLRVVLPSLTMAPCCWSQRCGKDTQALSIRPTWPGITANQDQYPTGSFRWRCNHVATLRWWQVGTGPSHSSNRAPISWLPSSAPRPASCSMPTSVTTVRISSRRLPMATYASGLPIHYRRRCSIARSALARRWRDADKLCNDARSSASAVAVKYRGERPLCSPQSRGRSNCVSLARLVDEQPALQV